MIKNCLFAVALASLALAVGCATGGNGVASPPSVEVTPSSVNSGAIYPTQTVTLTAATTSPAYAPVTWSLSGPGAITSSTPPDAATKTSATATYQAPTTVPAAGSQPTITATLVSDTSVNFPLVLTIVDITTDVSPATLSVGKGLTQTFTAVAVPDYAPQTFTWTCTAGGSANSCANFCAGSQCNPSIASGLAVYTAQDNCGSNCVHISAASTIDPTGCAANPNYCATAKASLVPSRVSGTYAFQFSGYDTNKSPVWVAGTFTTGTITNGVVAIGSGSEDILTASGPSANRIQITGGFYTPISSSDPNNPNNSNNAGTLTLTSSGVYPDQKYQVVLDGGGDIKMIESDGLGAGSGIAKTSSSSFTGTVAQTYAFGFTGVDSGGNRVGYAGVMGFNGTPNVANDLSGLIDVNDGGQSSNSVCSSTPPCTIAGKYTPNGNGSWSLTLTSPVNMSFDFFIASGSATSKTNPLTFYAVSTDPTLNPAVSGTMVLQDSSLTYNNAAFKDTSVSALTGVNSTCAAPPCTNVSLTLGTTDGNGNFSGQFDQNDAGAILSSAQFPAASQSPSPYTYAASSSTNGRYSFNMLGDPTKTTPVPPLPFILYASGANRGFLLDQSSSSVMTGTMNPQGQAYLGLPGSALPGTYAAATTSSGSSGVDAIAANLLLTWANVALVQGGCTSECVNGTQYDSLNYSSTGTPLALAYTLQDTGNGTIVPISPATTPNYVIYVQDISGCTKASGPVCAIQSFLIIDEDKTNPYPSIIFAQQ